MKLWALILLGLVATVFLAGGVLPATAGAAKCITCEGEEPGEEAEAQILTIEIAGHGSVGNGTKTYCENAGAASKSCQVEFAEGKKATLIAEPLGEYVFQGWSGACSGSGGCEVTMTEAKSVQATFTNPPPATPTITSPTSNQVFERTSEEPVSVSFTDSDSTIVEFRCHVDSQPDTSCSSPWGTPKLGAGEHTVSVSARDGAGNISTRIQHFKVVIASAGGEEPKDEPSPGGPGGGPPGPVVGSTTGTTGVAPAVKIDARPIVKARLLGKSTIFRKLTLKGLPAGASVAVTCKGKGCPFKRKQFNVTGGVANLSTFFVKRPLGAGALIELKASAPGMIGETVDVRTRAAKAPKVTTS